MGVGVVWRVRVGCIHHTTITHTKKRTYLAHGHRLSQQLLYRCDQLFKAITVIQRLVVWYGVVTEICALQVYVRYKLTTHACQHLSEEITIVQRLTPQLAPTVHKTEHDYTTWLHKLYNYTTNNNTFNRLQSPFSIRKRSRIQSPFSRRKWVIRVDSQPFPNWTSY